jgi:diguanylate cyclase (GGDEF)-like protein
VSVTTTIQQRARHNTAVGQFLIVCAIVAAFAYLGIWTRLHSSLAAFWPANAVLAASLVRWPYLRTRAGWAGALAGYYIADLTTGGAFVLTSYLTAANLIGVAAAVAVLTRLSETDLALRRPQSVLLVLGAGLAGTIGATISGAYVGVTQFDQELPRAIESWFSTELAGYMTCMVLVLSIPKWRSLVRWTRPAAIKRIVRTPQWTIPIVLFALAVFAAPGIAGASTLVLAIPILGWIGVNGSVFLTAAFGVIATATFEIMLRAGTADPGFDFNAMTSYEQASMRVSLCIMFMGPVMVATTSQQRIGQLAALQTAAAYDPHTGVLTRQAVEQRGQMAVTPSERPRPHIAAFIVDVDHFKRVNDTYSHSAGDAVLTAVAQRCRHTLREDDVFGRYGGDEFFGFLRNVSTQDAITMAERMCQQVAREPVEVDGTLIDVSVSIGIAHTAAHPTHSFEKLVHQADQALLEVKRTGRGRAATR